MRMTGKSFEAYFKAFKDINISAQSLQRLYENHQNKVLGRNLRYYIKSGAQAKDVDGAIAGCDFNSLKNR